MRQDFAENVPRENSHYFSRSRGPRQWPLPLLG
jgi:hypothetical protein